MTSSKVERLVWNVEQVCEAIDVSRAHLFQMTKRKEFPKGLILGRKRVWLVSDVRHWLDRRNETEGRKET